MIEPIILEWLNAGGNLALVALAYMIWRFDRRLLVLEIALENILNGKMERAANILAKAIRKDDA